MLSSVRAGQYTVRGISIGGVYTSIQVPELNAVFDCGIAPRSFAGVETLLLSHAHADHSGALVAMLGIRALHGQRRKLRVIMPAEIVDDLLASLRAMSSLQHWPLEIEPIGVVAGDEVPLRTGVTVRAIKTYHPVPSLAYQAIRRVQKLRPEFQGLPGAEIGARRSAGEDLFDVAEHLELAYATDTLVQVLDHEPSLYRSRVLVMECTFLDERKSLEAARAGCHIHLDELLERADRFENEHLVLMHFSQLYRPDEILPLLQRRLPPSLAARVSVLVPDGGEWPG